MQTCPVCGSQRVAYFQLDTDWATDAGYWQAANEGGPYEVEDLRSFELGERTQDICAFVCCVCGTVWDAPRGGVYASA